MLKIISWLLILFNIHILNKDKKIIIYKNILEYYNKILVTNNVNSYLYICLYLNKEFGEIINHITRDSYIVFPEIYISKPIFKKRYNIWFPSDREGVKQRIKIIKRAIKILEK